jgi:hypothetical protein
MAAAFEPNISQSEVIYFQRWVKAEEHVQVSRFLDDQDKCDYNLKLSLRLLRMWKHTLFFKYKLRFCKTSLKTSLIKLKT